MKPRTLTARLWRWNAYIIFLAGIAAIALLLVTIVMFIADKFDDEDTNVVSVAANRVAESSTRFGVFEIVPGTNVLRAPLYLDQKLAAAISKENTSVQNYLFCDPATATSHWLLSGPPTLLASTKLLPSREYSNSNLPVAAVVYEQVSRDTDGDQRLTVDDLKTIALSDATGKRFTPLFQNVSVLRAAELTKDGVILIYEDKKKMHAAVVDLATFRVVRETVIEPR